MEKVKFDKSAVVTPDETGGVSLGTCVPPAGTGCQSLPGGHFCAGFGCGDLCSGFGCY